MTREAGGPEPSSVRHGYRFASVDPGTGALLPLFRPQATPLTATWTAAVCHAEYELGRLATGGGLPTAELLEAGRELAAVLRKVGYAAVGQLHDLDPHETPGDRCGCGWRVYPDLDAVIAGVQAWPQNDPSYSFPGDGSTVLCGIDYGGGVAERHMRRWPDGRAEPACPDETSTIRAEWIRVVGPIYTGPGVARAARRDLAQRYHLRTDAVVQLPHRVAFALLDGDLPASTSDS